MLCLAGQPAAPQPVKYRVLAQLADSLMLSMLSMTHCSAMSQRAEQQPKAKSSDHCQNTSTSTGQPKAIGHERSQSTRIPRTGGAYSAPADRLRFDSSHIELELHIGAAPDRRRCAAGPWGGVPYQQHTCGAFAHELAAATGTVTAAQPDGPHQLRLETRPPSLMGR